MKKGGFLKRKTPLKAKTRIRLVGHSEVSELKREIQALVREIVIVRDGTCVLRKVRHCTDTVLQADHLITRSNSATYADTRLIVCLCRSCHGGFKQWHKPQYDALVKTLLSKERVALWDRCEQDSWRATRTGAYDWKIHIAALKLELSKMAQPQRSLAA